MSGPTFFTDLESGEEGNKERNDQPIWALQPLNPKNEDKVLSWLVNELDYLIEESRPRWTKVERNLQLYKGIQYWSMDSRGEDRGAERTSQNTTAKQKVQKIVINHIFDLAYQKAARLTEYKPAVDISPTTDDWQATLGAKVTQEFLEHIFYEQKFYEEVVPFSAQWSKPMGEVYCFVLWDQDAGPVDPDQKQMEAEGRKLYITGDDGKPVVGDDGKPIAIDQEVHLGDVVYLLEDTFNVLLQRGKMYFSQIEYCFRRELVPIHQIRAEYPEAASKIKSTKGAQVFDFEKMEVKQLRDHVEVWTMYHKPIKMFRSGLEIKFCRDAILGPPKPHQYKHGRLPVSRLADITRPRETHASSFFDNVKGATGAYNNITNLILRNAILFCNPKYMMPAGAADTAQLGNGSFITQFRGPVPPKLVQMQPTPPELFRFREELKKDAQQIAQVYGTSRGEPPPGIEAGIALQFLEEQEDKAAAPDVTNFYAFVRDVADLTVKTAAEKYDPNDVRTINVLGPNKQWMAKNLDIASIQKAYNTQVRNASSLPKGRAARMQSLVYLQQNYPDMVPREQVVDMMDLGQNQKFIDAATVAVRSAEAENGQMMRQQPIPEPEKFEHHIQHWKIHTKQIQEWSFKASAPPEVRKAFEEHIMATEMLMFEKGMQNPLFANMVAELPMYPMFFVPPPMPAAPPPGAEGEMPLPADETGGPPADAPEPSTGGEPMESNLPGNSLDMQNVPGSSVVTPSPV